MNRRQFITAGSAAAAMPFVTRRVSAFSWSLGENVSRDAGISPLLFGTDYYPDQTPEDLWEEDATAMSAMGITNVRIAEFAWALMEPQEGKFSFAWLDRAVGVLLPAGDDLDDNVGLGVVQPAVLLDVARASGELVGY